MAEYYGTVAGADAYHLARGNTAWAAGTDANKLSALYRASEYIDGTYRGRFSGYRTEGRDQTLEWPRTNATDIEGNFIATTTIPTEIVNATYEGALRELAETGALAPDVTSTSIGIKRKREKVGPIEEETEYTTGGAAARPVFSRIEEVLSGLFATRTGAGSVDILRI